MTCFYDTYSWLVAHDIEADGVAFTPEKFMWLSEQPYYTRGSYFAVDDSPKHAAEYAKHQVSVMVPEKPYNAEVKDLKNISYVPRDADPILFIPET